MSKDAIRKAAETDLWTFAQLVNPSRLYGEIHKKVFRWLQDTKTPNQLLLLPRGHMKSHCCAVWCAWWVTNHPDTTILYISATAQLAEDQLYAIKQMMDSDVYRRYWPQMLTPEEGKREKWAATSVCVDHPKRKLEGVRDPTIRTAGITTNTTGWHADIVVPDDVVVPDNAYTEEGRRKVAAAMSQMASIKNTGGMVKGCGTRYHPRDQYFLWKNQTAEEYNVQGEQTGEILLWTIMEEKVEVDQQFLWPRAQRGDGRWYGFDLNTLARIKAEYEDRTQFFAQYYNDPNDPGSMRISTDNFQYYDPKFITFTDAKWRFKDKALNVYAAIDFAFSLSAKADYSAIVVVGIDAMNEIYVLDIDRFKTDRIATYYDKVQAMHAKWSFRKLRAETTAAQQIIANDLKDRLKENGLSLSIDMKKPNRYQGSKEERMAAVLEPRYDNLQVWHYKGGYTPALEEELMLARPAHDDIKDTLAAVLEIAVKPKYRRSSNVIPMQKSSTRFGGF